jgi:cytochrome P450
VTFLELADPAFSVISAQVRQARDDCWYARTSYGIAVLRHNQATRLISHPNLRQGSSAWPAHHGITEGPFADWFASWVLNKEGADHRRLRKLLNPGFSRRLVEAMRPRFRSLATELVDGFAKPARCEFMADFAEPFSARAIAHVLGIPEREWPLIARDSATIGLAMSVRIREDLERIEAALQRLYGYADMMAKQTPEDLRRYAKTYIIGKPHVVGVLLSPEMRQRIGLTEAELAVPRGQP